MIPTEAGQLLHRVQLITGQHIEPGQAEEWARVLSANNVTHAQADTAIDLLGGTGHPGRINPGDICAVLRAQPPTRRHRPDNPDDPPTTLDPNDTGEYIRWLRWQHGQPPDPRLGPFHPEHHTWTRP